MLTETGPQSWLVDHVAESVNRPPLVAVAVGAVVLLLCAGRAGGLV